jgi:hypothetical protein
VVGITVAHPNDRSSIPVIDDEAMFEIDRASLSLPEVKAHLSEHMNVKASLKYYFVFFQVKMSSMVSYIIMMILGARKC